ncbi:hypothetical protein P4483_29195 [Bacillus thuringiensis]|nr:hypothetical protein [Bacillus thuringiensis]
MVRVLTQPEPGWQRIDDSDRNIIFEGENWFSGYSKYSDNYLKTFHYKSSSQPSNSVQIKFSFVGTKLRLIGLVNNGGYDRYATIVIDGNTERLDYDAWEGTRQAVIYEKTNLNKGPHTVTILGTYLNLDAIDIDSDGYVFTPKKVGEILDKSDPGWNRFDDADSLIKYGDGAWNRVTDDRYYNSTVIYSLTKSVVEFSFKGTGVRLVSKSVNLGYGPVDITIDGVKESYNPVLGSDNWKVLLYNKEGLKNEVHSVKLEGPEGIIMDAIDVLDGELVKTAKVGDVLLQPETGWKRIDDSNANIKYVGNEWLSLNITEQGHYMDTFHTYPKEGPKSIEFKFTGTKLRIIASKYTTLYDAVSIKIDGVTETYSQQDVSITDKAVSGILVYDKQGLSNTEHSVIITVPDNKLLTLDAIDIDATGSMVKPSAKVGDQLLQPETGWTRVDDANPLISYKGESWNLGTGDRSPSYYNKTNYFRTVDSPGSLQFSFKGTGIRIVSTLYNNVSAWTDVSVEIDGVAVGKYAQANGNLSAAKYVVLLFEKTGLNDGVHKIKLSGTKMNMDAFDILGGDIVKNQPKQLLQPESGWNRINNSDASINAVGFITGTDPSNGLRNCYMNDHIYSKDSGTVTFEFTGTGLRVLGLAYSNYSNNIVIDIDGVKDTFSEDYLIVPEYLQGSMLVYEKLNLENKKHTVTIHNGDTTKGFGFDAFDIFKPTAKVGDKLTQPEPGWKRIDDADSNIRYDGKWNFITTQKGAYNETLHYYSAPSGSTEEASATFKFKGTKLRLVALSSYFQKKAILKIDGVSYDLTKVEGRPPINGIQQTLMFEATGLEDKEHLVELSGIDITLDAIDIDKMGSLVKPKPPSKVGDILLQPEPGWNRVDDTNPLIHYRGDYWCRAIGTSASGATYNVTSTYRVPDYADKTVATVEFSFKGTGIRVISKMYDNDSWSDVSIEIDGLTQSYKANGPKREYQMLMYERNLPDGIHKVKISGTQCSFDAFDIKGGELIGTPTNLRDVLFEPEPGWKRINDTDSNIQYTGVWAAGPDVRCYDDTIHYKNSISNTPPDANPVSVKFNFEGTKLRIIGLAGPAYDSNAKILIDGVEESINFSRTSAVYPIYQSLIYEKLGLSNKVHTVEIKGKFINLDAIDIDESGSIGGKPSVKIGDQLLQPEDGWKRIDDTDPLIRYIGNWKLTTGNDKHYNKTTHYNLDKKLDTSFEFEFVGTKLRLLAYGDSGYDATSKVLIDGKEETMVYNSPSGNQVIRYEKIGLDRGKHTVKVIGKAMSLDSIDIDADGYLLARLGDKLVEPEPGWVRFDDTHKNIEYNGFWKTTEADVSCYNNTHHWKSKEDNNDSTISARFLFKGTKFRLISMTSPSYPEDIELKIDGQKEILKLSGEVMQCQTLAYEKKNLEDMIHVIELSGKYISIDAIDLEEGATLLKLPDEKLKPYQIRSGLIFKDDYDTFDSRWIASPVGSYSLIDRKGYFRMLHNVSRDTLLLADLPNEKEFAFEVSADYTPTHEDDKGGIIVWKNGEENIEFLETEDGTRETTELKWMACKDNEDWTFFSDYGEGFNFYDSDRMNCSKFGVVLKKGSNSKFVNLDIDSIIATRGRKLTIANIAPNISVEMEDEFGRIIFNGNTGYNTGIQITLPSLEFAGKVILKNVEGKELGVIKNTFYGGDVYGFGSNLEIKFSGEELSTLAQTRLPDMISGKSEIMLELVNPSVARANNVNLSIAQYEDKFGWSWADLALDSNGKPGQYQDSINIPYVNPENTIKFWLKVTKGTDYVGLAPLQFQIHLEHE